MDPYEDVSSYLACQVLLGRPLFDVLADRFAQQALDDHPAPLEAVARDPLVRAALTA